MMHVFESAVAAAMFATAFFAGGRWLHDYKASAQTLSSIGSGMSAAYVFVHVMPELAKVRLAFVASVSVPLQFEGMAIYLVALIGFLCFFALNNLYYSVRSRHGELESAFRLQLGGFSIYVLLMGYLLSHHLEQNPPPFFLFASAIALHFVAVARMLQYQFGERYRTFGRYLLAVASLLGWLAGMLFTLPHYLLAIMVAIVSGGIVMNSTFMELTEDHPSRIFPFILGGLLYGLVLLPLG